MHMQQKQEFFQNFTEQKVSVCGMESVENIFQNITEQERSEMMRCFQAAEKRYVAGNIISTYQRDNQKIGILQEGEANLVRIHPDGRQTILEDLHAGDIFGEALTFENFDIGTMQVICTKSCRIIFFDYACLIRRCQKACSFHSRLVHNSLQIMSRKAVQLSERMEILSQRSIRDKLSCYFSIMAARNHSNTFQLPFSLSNLADYLAVDRSAMMRELKKMKEERLVEMEKRRIVTILPKQTF